MEKVVVLLLTSWSTDFREGRIISVPKKDIDLNARRQTRLKSLAHVQYYGYIGKDFIVLDFIADADNITDAEFEMAKMLYPQWEIEYERGL